MPATKTKLNLKRSRGSADNRSVVSDPSPFLFNEGNSICIFLKGTSNSNGPLIPANYLLTPFICLLCLNVWHMAPGSVQSRCDRFLRKTPYTITLPNFFDQHRENEAPSSPPSFILVQYKNFICELHNLFIPLTRQGWR